MTPSNDLLNLDLACGNGSKFNISKCNSLKCKFKAEFQLRHKAVSLVTKCLYDCMVQPGIISLNVHCILSEKHA